jgi:hypothetical protein
MSRSSAPQLVDGAESGWPNHALPWLLSSAIHCGLLIALGICVARSQGAADRAGSTTGIAFEGSVTIASQADREYYDSAPDMLMPQDGEQQTPGDNPTPAQVDAAAESGGGPLASVLASKSLVDFADLLPSARPVLGAGSLEGGGVGTAKATTTGSQGSNKLRGGYARTGVFGVQGEGHKFTYVFDRSGSMGGYGGSPLAAAKAQLIASFRQLGQTHQFQVIFYNEHPHVFNLAGAPGKLVFGTDYNKDLAEQFVASITADGATEHEEALTLALRNTPDVIFFLTDADEPRMNPRQLAHIARINKGTVINAIEFGYGAQVETENFLVRLARENGGKHVYVDISQLPQP